MVGAPGQAFRNVLKAVREVRKFEQGDVITLCHAMEDVSVKEEIATLLIVTQLLVKVRNIIDLKFSFLSRKFMILMDLETIYTFFICRCLTRIHISQRKGVW